MRRTIAASSQNILRSRATSLGGTIDYFRDTTFNSPTLAEAYKVAGLDGLNKL